MFGEHIRPVKNGLKSITLWAPLQPFSVLVRLSPKRQNYTESVCAEPYQRVKQKTKTVKSHNCVVIFENIFDKREARINPVSKK